MPFLKGNKMRLGMKSWSKGLTKETDDRVRKQSESQKGKLKSEKHKRNLRKVMKGKHNSIKTEFKKGEQRG